MMLRSSGIPFPPLAILSLLAVVAIAGGASAAPISMDPGSVTLDTVTGSGNAFTITFDGGDTSDNVLDFTALGGGSSSPFWPSTALAAIVFDDTSILSAGDTVSGFFDPANVVRGIALPGTGVAAAVLVDAGSPSSESFWIQLASAPTTATVYSLTLDDLDTRVHDLGALLAGVIDSQEVAFSFEGGDAVVPEPSAALVFGVGLLITRSVVRRRSA